MGAGYGTPLGAGDTGQQAQRGVATGAVKAGGAGLLVRGNRVHAAADSSMQLDVEAGRCGPASTRVSAPRAGAAPTSGAVAEQADHQQQQWPLRGGRPPTEVRRRLAKRAPSEVSSTPRRRGRPSSVRASIRDCGASAVEPSTGPAHIVGSSSVRSSNSGSSTRNNGSRPGGESEHEEYDDGEEDRGPFAIFNVTLRDVPTVNTEAQTFTVDMDVKLNVYIPELQTELLRFIRTGADSEKDRYVAIPETLELVDFPVDVQRLHVTYEFELDEKSLDKDVSHDAVVTRLAANVDFFDMSKVETSDMAHDGEWALCRDEVEIYARLLSNDKLSVQFVIIAKRRPIFYIINVMLPVWCIVLFSFLSFRFDSVELGARLQVTLTMVLTLVAFKLSVSTAKYVPITNSMNLMDRFMIAAFVMVALVALQNYIVFELLDIAPWLNIVSAWALIALWIATNAVVFTTFAKALAMVRSGDEVEKKKDVRRLREKDYNRVANLLTATEIQKGVRGIENMWSKHGATACRALEVVASLLEDRNETVRLCKLSLVVTEKKMSSNNPYTLSSVMYLADELESRGKLDEAATLYRRALEGRQKVLGPEHADTLITLNNLAVVLMRQDKLKEAEELHRMELAIREKALGRAHLDTLLSLNNLAITLGERHELNESEKLLREALKGRETVLGPEDPVTLQSVSNLADVLWEQGGDKQDEAEELAWKAMRGRQKVLGDRHVDTLDSLTSLAGMLADQGKRDKAEKLYKRALRSYEKVPGAGREAPVTLTCLHNLGYVLAKQGNVTEAEKVYRRALEARTKVLGPEHPDTLITLSNLADVLANQDKLGEAASLHRRALQARIKVLGPDDADTLESANSLADVLDKQGKGGEAEELRRSARTHPQH